MRAAISLLVCLSLVLTAGCFGADVHDEPLWSPSAATSSSAAGPVNESPVARFILLNATGVATSRHFVGENITADASSSSDRDGSIANYTWRTLRYGLFDPDFPDHFGQQIALRFDAPGDRLLVLQVRDDKGATHSEYHAFGVNQHRIESGRALLSPALPAGVPLGAPSLLANFSLPVVAGVVALSINATFTPDEASKLRLEIRAPNGTLLNRSEGMEAPLWAIAAPLPGVVGNYTAHVSLASGVALDYRIEFVAWYGYS